MSTQQVPTKKDDSSIEEVSVFMLTTIDNPYDPFTDFDNWFAYDVQKGYNSCGYLARIANVSEELSETDRRLETNRAINEIVRLNVLGIYKKLEEGSFEKSNKTIINVDLLKP